MTASTSPTGDFPTGFLWGSATASHQVEGDNVNNDWWEFEQTPGTAAKESSGDAIDHLHRYSDDFALLASMGHNTHRLSLEWSRIEPSEGEFSRAAIAHYRAVLTALAESNMTSFVTLHHFTLPRWFAQRGGWLAPDAVEIFSRFCRRVVRELGPQLEFVCTINEPQMVALHGYLEGYHPPGHTNPGLWKRVGRVLLEAHFEAVKAVHEGSSASAGIVLQLPLLSPARDDADCAVFLNEFRGEVVDLYLDGLKGPDRGDWLGVQYYREQWVDPAKATIFSLPPAGVQLTQMGWAIRPDGLRQVLHRAATTGLPIYVTENGIATEDDEERIDYIESHLAATLRAMREGVDVRGYLHWSAFDNFEWSEGYTPKFGLIAVDRDDDFRRIPKPSAAAFSRVARSGRLADLRAADLDSTHDEPNGQAGVEPAVTVDR